ncbi:MAG: AlwI family type II restriction endonuclease [Nitrososphaerota archaeon]
MRKTSLTRIWFVPTSPRSPYKIKYDLQALMEFDRKIWDKDTQLQYAENLKRSPFFEGETSIKYTDLSARDRLRAIKTLGFGYVDSQGILRITEAGRKLVENENVEDLFLKQLLKWQFPSWQHGGMKAHLWKYPSDAKIHPFFETLRAVKELGGKLFLEEMAIFLLPCWNTPAVDKAIEKIREFRKELRNISGKREKKIFIQKKWFEEYHNIYKEDILSGRIKTREIPTRTIEDFLEKKMRNARDYADAAFRYFSYTGILIRRRNELSIPILCRFDVDKILDMEIPFNQDYKDVDRFYQYFGDPSIPELPWEKPEILRKRIINVSHVIVKEGKEAVQFTLNDLLSKSYEELTTLYMKIQENKLMRQLKADFPKNIVDEYEKILSRKVEDPPLFFEWNTWRAFLVMDDYCALKPNFKMDMEFNPKSPAPAGKADMEVIYCGDFATLVEVTLRRGDTQYWAEAEPVSRHVKEYEDKQKIPTFGLFIAPTIAEGSKHFFFMEHKLSRPVTVVPISLEQFKRILYSVGRNGFLRGKLRKMFEESRKMAIDLNDYEKWHKEIDELLKEIFPL